MAKKANYRLPEANFQCTRVRFLPAELILSYLCRNIPLEPGYVLCPPRGHGERNGKKRRASNPGIACLPRHDQNYTLVRFFLSKLVVVSSPCREKQSKMYPSTRSPGKRCPPSYWSQSKWSSLRLSRHTFFEKGQA